MVPTSQFHVALRLGEGTVSQPPLQHHRRHAVQNGVASVGVPEGMGMGPRGVQPRLDGRFLHALADPLPADVEEVPRAVLGVDRGQVPQELHQVGGMGTSLPFLLLLPVTSGRSEMIGGSWLNRMSAALRERHSPTRNPVRSITLMAIAPGRNGPQRSTPGPPRG